MGVLRAVKVDGGLGVMAPFEDFQGFLGGCWGLGFL